MKKSKISVAEFKRLEKQLATKVRKAKKHHSRSLLDKYKLPVLEFKEFTQEKWSAGSPACQVN